MTTAPPPSRPDLLDRTREFLSGAWRGFLAGAAGGFLRPLLKSLTRWLVASALLCCSAVFLLIGLVQLLEKEGVAGHLAYLLIGFLALLVGTILCLWKPK